MSADFSIEFLCGEGFAFVLVILTLPLNLLTLGLFTLVINGLLLALTARLVKGFEVGDFGRTVLAALIISFVSFLLSWMAREKK